MHAQCHILSVHLTIALAGCIMPGISTTLQTNEKLADAFPLAVVVRTRKGPLHDCTL